MAIVIIEARDDGSQDQIVEGKNLGSEMLVKLRMTLWFAFNLFPLKGKRIKTDISYQWNTRP